MKKKQITVAAALLCAFALAQEVSQAETAVVPETTAEQTSAADETVPAPSEDDPTQEKLWSQGYEDGYKEGYDAGLIDGEAQERAASDGAAEEAYKQGFADGKDAAKEELGEQQIEKQEVKISGQFTATVRVLMPDYLNDYDTIRAAVVQGFQSTPSFIMTQPDTLKPLREGEQYTFILKEQTVYMDPTDLFDGEFSIEGLAGMYIEFSEVRAPKDGEGGLDSDRLHYEKN